MSAKARPAGRVAGQAQSVVLGLDVGTSSVRALLYDTDGTAVPGIEHQVTYTTVADSTGRLTADADVLFALLVDAIDALAGYASRRRLNIVGVGMSAFWHTLIAIGPRQRPLTPVLLWADTRAELVVPELARRADVSRLHRRTGCRLHSSYWPAKLTWLEVTAPDVFARSLHFVSFAEFAFYRLFGRYRVGLSMASGTGLLNTSSRDWDEYALAAAPTGTRERLSPIGDDPFVGLRGSFAKRWPGLSQVPWFPAYGDGACSNIGATGVSTHGLWVVTVGTSAAIRVVTPNESTRRALPPALWRYLVDDRRQIVGGALSEGGNLIAWLKTTMRIEDLQSMEETVAHRPPDAAQLTILPFIAGERSPGWTYQARALFSGVTLATRPVDFLQASMESVSYELRLVYDQLVAALGEPKAVLATGAALARSKVWVQILANVLECRLLMAAEVESSSRGAALLVLQQLGAARESDTRRSGNIVHPKASDAYERARARQQAFRSMTLRKDELTRPRRDSRHRQREPHR